jgi:hypothetical protein
MIPEYRMVLAALSCTAAIMTAFGAFADDAAGAKNPEEIGRQLKSRGPPLLRTALGEPNPGGSCADVKAVPLVPQPPKPGTGQAVPLVPQAPNVSR